jgi:hypothetical protein
MKKKIVRNKYSGAFLVSMKTSTAPSVPKGLPKKNKKKG